MSQPQLMVDESIPFSEWQDEQDWDYTNTDGEIIDYINKFVNYNEVDDSWEETFASVSEINPDSDEFQVAREHITAYRNE